MVCLLKGHVCGVIAQCLSKAVDEGIQELVACLLQLHVCGVIVQCLRTHDVS